MKLGVAFGWHTLAWEDLLSLVSRAEALGFDTAYVDGDVSQLSKRREIDVLDGWTVTTALLARTERIRIGSIRLVQHWNAAHLAQVTATAERLHPGRLQFFVSIGDRPEDRRLESAAAARARANRLARREPRRRARAVARRDRDTARCPRVARGSPRAPDTARRLALPIEIAAKSGRLMSVVARHADVWNVNWPRDPRAGRRIVGGARCLVPRDRAEPRRHPAPTLDLLPARPQPRRGAGRVPALEPLVRRDFRMTSCAARCLVGPARACRDQIAELARALSASRCRSSTCRASTRPVPAETARGTPRGRDSLTPTPGVP